MLPRPFLVADRRQDTVDTVTLALEPVGGQPLAFTPGQFTMLGVLGVGEVPISVSSDPASPVLLHTIRDVGGVTHALTQAQVGDVLEVRGPYGHGWDVTDGAPDDVLVVAGGIGLAPLRPALLQLLAERDRYRSVALLYGARSPGDRLYPDELFEWARRGIDIDVIVDQGVGEWTGRVGLVTSLIAKADVDPSRTLALVCGPEVMMRYVTAGLIDRGVSPDRIRLSMERNMSCGVGLCGHCQLRELFVCVDGPVFAYPTLAPLLGTREV